MLVTTVKYCKPIHNMQQFAGLFRQFIERCRENAYLLKLIILSEFIIWVEFFDSSKSF